METHNNPTPQRTEAKRSLSAPVMHIDIQQQILDIAKEKSFQQKGKNALTLFKNELMTQTLIILDEGETIQSKTFEQFSTFSFHLTEGQLEANYGQAHTITPGQLLILNHPHEFTLTASKPSTIILTTSSFY